MQEAKVQSQSQQHAVELDMDVCPSCPAQLSGHAPSPLSGFLICLQTTNLLQKARLPAFPVLARADCPGGGGLIFAQEVPGTQCCWMLRIVPRGQGVSCPLTLPSLGHCHHDFMANTGYLPCLFFFCSSSSPGTPGMPRKVLWEFPYHTSSSWSGGIICRKRGRKEVRAAAAAGRKQEIALHVSAPHPGLRKPTLA